MSEAPFSWNNGDSYFNAPEPVENPIITSIRQAKAAILAPHLKEAYTVQPDGMLSNGTFKYEPEAILALKSSWFPDETNTLFRYEEDKGWGRTISSPLGDCLVLEEDAAP